MHIISIQQPNYQNNWRQPKRMKLIQQTIPSNEADKLEREQRLKYGDTLSKILADEAKKFHVSVEDFLVSPVSANRLKELSEIFDLMNKKDYKSPLEISAGAPGLGKHKS